MLCHYYCSCSKKKIFKILHYIIHPRNLWHSDWELLACEDVCFTFEFWLSWSLSTFLYIYALIVWYKTKRTWSNEEVLLLFIIFSFLCKQRHIHVACTLIVKPLQPRASLFRYYSNIWICVPTNILRAETSLSIVSPTL